MNDLKRKLTDILAYVLGIGGVVVAALEGLPEGSDWYVVAGVAAFAILSWFMGRNGDGSAKSVPSKV